jgi:transcription initiation factor IIE alpha subunit
MWASLPPSVFWCHECRARTSVDEAEDDPDGFSCSVCGGRYLCDGCGGEIDRGGQCATRCGDEEVAL